MLQRNYNYGHCIRIILKIFLQKKYNVKKNTKNIIQNE